MPAADSNTLSLPKAYTQKRVSLRERQGANVLAQRLERTVEKSDNGNGKPNLKDKTVYDYTIKKSNKGI